MRKRSDEECEEDGNGGYKTMTDAASTYVLCPCLWNQVSVNSGARKTVRMTENKARMYRF